MEILLKQTKKSKPQNHAWHEQETEKVECT